MKLLHFSTGDTLIAFILRSEALGLAPMCAVAGELHFRDLIAAILAERKMGRMARFNALTDVTNRRGLEERIDHHLSAIERGRPLTLILIDIDHLKSVNDTFGHDVGDAVLKAVAQSLLKRVRQLDILGRWGGVEFLVVCPDTHATPAAWCPGGRLQP